MTTPTGNYHGPTVMRDDQHQNIIDITDRTQMKKQKATVPKEPKRQSRLRKVMFMKIKDIMTKSIAIIDPEDTVIQAAQLMKKHNVGSIPVCRGEKVIGIITDRDIALKAVANGSDPGTLRVGEIMSKNPILGNPDMDVTEAGKLMGKNQIRRLPIVDNHRLVGIVSLGDIAIEPMMQDEAGGILTEVSESSYVKTEVAPEVQK